MSGFARLPIKTVFDRVTRAAGYDPATVAYTSAEKERVADLVNDAVELAWRRAMWPFLMEVRRISYRPLWSENAVYDPGDEVYHNGAYHRAVDPSAGEEPSAPRWITNPEDFLPSFPFAENAIDEVDLAACVYASHPDLVRDPRPYACRRTDYGAAVVEDGAPVLPYVRYRPVPPRFTWANTTPGTNHGDVWYDAASGDCRVFLGEGDTPIMPFPAVFAGFCVRYASALRLRDEDGRAEALEEAWSELDRVQSAQEDATRTSRRAAVRVLQRRI